MTRGLKPTSCNEEVSPLKKARNHEISCTGNIPTRAELAVSLEGRYTKSQINDSFMFGLPDCFDGKSQEEYLWVLLWNYLT